MYTCTNNNFYYTKTKTIFVNRSELLLKDEFQTKRAKEKIYIYIILYIPYSYSKLLELSVCDADVLESEKKKNDTHFHVKIKNLVNFFPTQTLDAICAEISAIKFYISGHVKTMTLRPEAPLK